MSSSPLEQGLPPSVRVDVTRGDLRAYWLQRAAQHTGDSYAGVSLSKFPEDLRVYEHLLWLDRPDTVIEIGTAHGASALWFRDRLRALRSYGRIERAPRVVTIDIDHSLSRPLLEAADPSFGEEIEMIEADVSDPGLPDRVAAALDPSARCLVVEDSAHEAETTWAALEGFARFVPPGGFFVVEDGCVDVEELRLPGAGWPRGVLPTLERWLQTPPGAEFEVRRDLELYGVTCHPGGFLRRRP
jgi:cephalosporin hydroxylase